LDPIVVIATNLPFLYVTDCQLEIVGAVVAEDQLSPPSIDLITPLVAALLATATNVLFPNATEDHWLFSGAVRIPHDIPSFEAMIRSFPDEATATNFPLPYVTESQTLGGLGDDLAVHVSPSDDVMILSAPTVELLATATKSPLAKVTELHSLFGSPAAFRGIQFNVDDEQLDTVVVPFSIGVSVVVVPLPKLVVTDKMDLAIFRVVSSNGGGLQLKIGRLIKTRKK